MVELLGSVRQSYGFDLMLQCRQEHEEFKVYKPGGLWCSLFSTFGRKLSCESLFEMR